VLPGQHALSLWVCWQTAVTISSGITALESRLDPTKDLTGHVLRASLQFPAVTHHRAATRLPLQPPKRLSAARVLAETS